MEKRKNARKVYLDMKKQLMNNFDNEIPLRERIA